MKPIIPPKKSRRVDNERDSARRKGSGDKLSCKEAASGNSARHSERRSSHTPWMLGPTEYGDAGWP